METKMSAKKFFTENKNKILKFCWNFIENLSQEKKRVIENDKIYYRRICISIDDQNNYEAYDTSTDIYRPLNMHEIIEMKVYGVERFCDNLFIKNSITRIKTNREYMQIAIAKKNEKNKEYHYKIANKEIKVLKEFKLKLGYQQNIN